MMRPVGDDLKVYLHRKTVDMRRGRNGLAAIAREAMAADVFSGALYIFVGRRFDTVKILYWHRCGFAVWHMVIESDEKFHWPRLLEEEVITMTTEQLNWLLDGYDVWRQPHKMLRYLHPS
jgi:transposase